MTDIRSQTTESGLKIQKFSQTQIPGS